MDLYNIADFLLLAQAFFFIIRRNENISIKCERGFKPFSHYFFTESEVQ